MSFKEELYFYCADSATDCVHNCLPTVSDSTNTTEYFKIDKATGRLLQIKSIDRENISSISLVIKVSVLYSYLHFI